MACFTNPSHAAGGRGNKGGRGGGGGGDSACFKCGQVRIQGQLALRRTGRRWIGASEGCTPGPCVLLSESPSAPLCSCADGALDAGLQELSGAAGQ